MYSPQNILFIGLAILLVIMSILISQNINRQEIDEIKDILPLSKKTINNGTKNDLSPIIIEVGLNQEESALGVKVMPIKMVEDSRCPIDVVCFQAGTVRVEAKFAYSGISGSRVFSLNSFVTIGDRKITLIKTSPLPEAGKIIDKKDYQFAFEIRVYK